MWFKKKTEREKINSSTAKLIYDALIDENAELEIDNYTASFNGIEIWLSNYPYSDMNLYEPFELKFCDGDRKILRNALRRSQYNILKNKLTKQVKL